MTQVLLRKRKRNVVIVVGVDYIMLKSGIKKAKSTRNLRGIFLVNEFVFLLISCHLD